MNQTANSPTAKLRRTQRGQCVAMIQLSRGHRILVDARHAVGEDSALVTRINGGGAICWTRTLPTRALKRYLRLADGRIETAGSPRDCPGWPSRLQDVGRTQG